MSKSNVTSHGFENSEVQPPRTADKPATIHKKRGRKGNKIKEAFKNIPSEPVDFVEYCTQHDIQPTVMRQIKRHDAYPEAGQVFVLQDRATKKMQIWRDSSIPSKYLISK